MTTVTRCSAVLGGKNPRARTCSRQAGNSGMCTQHLNLARRRARAVAPPPPQPVLRSGEFTACDGCGRQRETLYACPECGLFKCAEECCAGNAVRCFECEQSEKIYRRPPISSAPKGTP